ncbi:MAG: helix-turn-helix transcriptional regulator [Balneolales bacterium]
MPPLTENDLLDRFELHTLQLENQLLEGKSFESVSNQVPYAVHLNSSTTFELLQINRKFSELLGYSFDEIKSMGREFYDNNIHPESTASVAKFLPELPNKKFNKPIPFIQHVKQRNATEYTPVFTFTKITKLPDNAALSLSTRLTDFGVLSKKMEQVLEMDRFKLMHSKRFHKLTGREVEILGLLANGISNSAIAGQLFISKQTVQTHRKHIINKLEIKSYHDLIKYAITFDLVKL